jgi:molybdenum cofactor cytidylyltransferase
VVLVLGYRAKEIRERIRFGRESSRLEVVENSGYREGISSSILSGLSRVEKNYDHVMILLGDMPLITSGVINRLLSGYLDSGLSLGALQVRGRRSHPVVIGRPFFPDLHRLTGDQGARELFIRHGDQLCMVDPGEDYDDRDIDTYEDYLKFRKTLE